MVAKRKQKRERGVEKFLPVGKAADQISQSGISALGLCGGFSSL